MKVSLLIPIYNVEKYIERCAHSLFQQSYKNIEYIFVDDCTKDRSIELLLSTSEKYPERKEQVRIIHHSENKGLAAARKTAIQNCTGQYIMHIDSDDYIDNYAVESCINLAIKQGADIVALGIKHIYKHQIKIESPNIGHNKFEYIDNLLNRKTPVNLVAQFCKKELIKDDALPIIGLNFAEDYATTTRIAYYAEKIVKLEQPVYNYWHENENSYTNNISFSRINDIMKAFNIIYNFYENKPEFKEYNYKLKNAYSRNIVMMLVLCKNEDLSHIISLNLELMKPSDVSLTLKHKIIYTLFYYRKYKLLKIYKALGLFISRYI